ncbi:MAG: hypothetical protein V2B15_00375 [Bacteroidota bacterium]
MLPEAQMIIIEGILRKVTTLAIAIALSVSIFAQEVEFELQWGGGNTKMEVLKEYGHFVDRRIPIEAKIIEEYPPYFYYQPQISVHIRRFRVGIANTWQSSGSRYSLKDYSGEYTFDTRIKMNAPALFFGVVINPDNRFQISINNEGGIIVSGLTLSEELTLDSRQVLSESFDFKSTNGFIEPGVRFAYGFGFLRAVEAYISLSYLRQFEGKGFHWTDDAEIYLYTPACGQINPDWSGYRIGIGLTVNLSLLL